MAGRLIVLVSMLAAATIARATPSQEELARSHFVAGEQEYARARWREALHEFQLGYALSPRPEFLINFAQVYRKLGDYEAAGRECQRYLATAPPPDLAAQAQRLCDQIKEEQAKAPPDVVAPPTTPPPKPVAPAPVVAAPAPPVVSPAMVATPPPPKKKRTWIAPVVVSCVLVAAAAVTIGVVFGVAPRDTFKMAPLGTVDFR